VRPINLICGLSALGLLLGCASQESASEKANPVAAATAYLKQSREKQKPESERIGFLLAAARASLAALQTGAANAARTEARLIYNTATTELTLLLQQSGRWNATTIVKGPDGTYGISFTSRNRGIWDPAAFDAILAPSKEKGLSNVVNPEGFGATVVGIHKPPDPRKWLLPRIGVSAAVTAIADFDDSRPPETVNVRITLYDPTKRDHAWIAKKERLLRADFGAPLAYYPNPWWIDYAALLDAARYEDREGLYLVQPYDPGKIPVVLVHGLMSIPQMWLPIINQIEKDPELRGRFQFWTYAYPTGDPVALSALGLRESLRKAYEIYPRTKNLVMVSYSLGGLVGKMLVQTTGATVWNEVFKNDAARLQTELPPDSLLKRTLHFKADSRIERIVFICTPHLGSPLAAGPLGQAGRSLILLPVQVLRGVGNVAGQSLAAAIGKKGAFLPNSIWGLSPKSPLLLSLYPLPVNPPFHSIIGNRGLDNIPLKESSDGVVPYWSSHLPRAASERIVPAQHVTACQNPETIEELKRILRLHLEQML
jgi:hypothetical protein